MRNGIKKQIERDLKKRSSVKNARIVVTDSKKIDSYDGGSRYFYRVRVVGRGRNGRVVDGGSWNVKTSEGCCSHNVNFLFPSGS
jgi:hypothetical protein